MDKIVKGDIVKLKISVDWVSRPDHLKVEDIIIMDEKSKWIVCVLNATYSHSDGKKSNNVLLEYLEKDIASSRSLAIDQLNSLE